MSLRNSNPIPRQSRSQKSLNPKLDRRLLNYTAAAGAAAVGVLALAQSSDAEIVFTPTHQMIPMKGTLALDLNGDGITDFTFHHIVASCGMAAECSQFTEQFLGINGNTALNGAWMGTRWASALPPGKTVGPGEKFASFGSMEQCYTQAGGIPSLTGPWVNVQNKYLGLAFTIDGETHYGWARLSVTIKPGACRPATIFLTGYAYETVAGAPITTGKRSGTPEVGEVTRPQPTLGLLAQGCLGIDVWRRDDDPD